MTSRRRAFTLIELLVVIAIISLLIALVIQSWGPIKAAVNRARCQSTLKGLQGAYMAYVEQRCRGSFPPYWSSSEYSGNDNYATWLPVDPNYRIVEAVSSGPRSFTPAFGPLVFEQYVRDSDVFVCPVLRDSGDEWWHELPKPAGQRVFFHDAMTNWDPMTSYGEWMKGNKTLGRYSSASYCLRFGLYPHSQKWLMDNNVNAFLADNFHFHYTDPDDAEYDLIRQRHVTGVNVAYLDGSVEYREDPILFSGNYDGSASWTPLSADGGVMKNTKMWKMWASFDQKQ